MKEYFLPTFIFKKKWVWFSEPRDVKDADMVTFFSYTDVAGGGFSKKEGMTSVIDLTIGEAAIWRGMRERFIRQQIQKGQRNNIQIQDSQDFDAFSRIYTSFREGKRIPHDNQSLFRDHGLLLLASRHNEVLAGGVFIYDDMNMRAWALASLRFSDDGSKRELVGQANRMIIWQAIRIACARKIRRFDLGGLGSAEDRSNLTEFKEAFGGVRVRNYYYTKVYSPTLSALLWVRDMLKI